MQARSNIQNITVLDVHQVYLILGPQRVLWIQCPVFCTSLGDTISSSHPA